MFKHILCAAMGRSGSHAIARWVHAQYPEHLKSTVHSDPVAGEVPTFRRYLTEKPSEYIVFRQECIVIRRLAQYAMELGVDMDVFSDSKRLVYGWRDPWNHFAALLRYYERDNRHSDHASRLSVIHRMYIPNHKVILKNVLGIGRRCLPESAVFLNYNEWFRSESYRNEIAGRLRLPTSHKGLSVVWIGSGFDNVTDATKLSVFDS